jgi:hypothetical protein
MRVKKPLILVALILTVVALLLGTSGLAQAAPNVPVKHQCVAIKGDLGFSVNEVLNYPGTLNPKTGIWTMTGNWGDGPIFGDMDGTLHTEFTEWYPDVSPDLAYWYAGKVTFKGMVKGVPTTWVGLLTGRGNLDLSSGFAGAERETITFCGKGLIGTITLENKFGYGPGIDYYTYQGTIVW